MNLEGSDGLFKECSRIFLEKMSHYWRSQTW